MEVPHRKVKVMTCTHTANCIENALGAISDNNLDTLVERGINARLAGVTDWSASNRIIDDELEAAFAAGTLCRPTEDLAIEWLADGTVACAYGCEA